MGWDRCRFHPRPSLLPSRERGLLAGPRSAPGIPRSFRSAHSRPLTLREGGMDSCLRRNDGGGCWSDEGGLLGWRGWCDGMTGSGGMTGVG